MSNPSATDFLVNLADAKLRQIDRAVGLLWWAEIVGGRTAMSARDIAEQMEDAGYARPNLSRLRTQLARDRRTAKSKGDSFRIRADSLRQVEEQFGPHLQFRPIRASDSVLPRDLFVGTRGYLERVVAQINGSYDAGLHDCCAVMSRRLLETLVIEVYEHSGRADELKGSDGNFLMFAGLLRYIENDTLLSLSRNGLRGLRDFKALGDLSAHSRRFNARRSDIDRVRDGIRVASEELLALAGFS